MGRIMVRSGECVRNGAWMVRNQDPGHRSFFPGIPLNLLCFARAASPAPAIAKIVTNAEESYSALRGFEQLTFVRAIHLPQSPTMSLDLHAFTSRSTRLVLCFALASTSALAQRASAPVVRVGVVDSRLLLQDMPGRAQAESEFALDMAKAREMVHTATDSMKAAVEELSRHEADLRPQQREAAMMMLRARELALEDMVAQLNAITGTRLSQLRQPLVDRIRSAVTAVRERERLTLVFDLGADGAPIAFDDAVNITPLVLEELRRQPKPVR